MKVNDLVGKTIGHVAYDHVNGELRLEFTDGTHVIMVASSAFELDITTEVTKQVVKTVVERVPVETK